MIKSWYKYNEYFQELTREMIVDIIYYRNFTLLSYDEKLSRDIDSLIDYDLEEYINFSSEDTTFINRKEYREAQDQIDQIYKISLDHSEIKEKLISIYSRVKQHMGKIGFSDYEEVFMEYIDGGYDIEFLLKPSDCMEVEIKKISNISEHISLLNSIQTTIKRIIKIYNLPNSSVYIKEAEFSKDGLHNESHVKIILL